jgi:hypothetical protein
MPYIGSYIYASNHQSCDPIACFSGVPSLTVAIANNATTLKAPDEQEMMLAFWYDKSHAESKVYANLHANKILLSFEEHLELALEWALTDDRLEQVKMLKPCIEDFPRFLYGMKKCRRDEGYGTTLAELYEYEAQPKLTEFLEPLLKFLKNEPKFQGKPKFVRWSFLNRILNSRKLLGSHACGG